MVFKCLFWSCAFFFIRSVSQIWTLRSSGSGLLTIPAVKTKTHGGASFQHHGPCLWNSLPDEHSNNLYFKCFLSWVLLLWVGCCLAAAALGGNLHPCFAVVCDGALGWLRGCPLGRRPQYLSTSVQGVGGFLWEYVYPCVCVWFGGGVNVFFIVLSFIYILFILVNSTLCYLLYEVLHKTRFDLVGAGSEPFWVTSHSLQLYSQCLKLEQILNVHFDEKLVLFTF